MKIVPKETIRSPTRSPANSPGLFTSTFSTLAIGYCILFAMDILLLLLFVEDVVVVVFFLDGVKLFFLLLLLFDVLFALYNACNCGNYFSIAFILFS